VALHFRGLHVAEDLELPASVSSGGESQETGGMAKQNFLAGFCAVAVGGERPSGGDGEGLPGHTRQVGSETRYSGRYTN
jgi:hypothetical protein